MPAEMVIGLSIGILAVPFLICLITFLYDGSCGKGLFAFSLLIVVVVGWVYLAYNLGQTTVETAFAPIHTVTDQDRVTKQYAFFYDDRSLIDVTADFARVVPCEGWYLRRTREEIWGLGILFKFKRYEIVQGKEE